MVVATKTGEILDVPGLSLGVWDGFSVRPPEPDELIPLPEGSDLFLLPGRIPLGFEGKKNHLIEFGGDDELGPIQAVCAFLAPAHLRLHHPAVVVGDEAPQLPMFAYAPVGWLDGKFWTTGLRIDPSRRQDPLLFDDVRIRRSVERELLDTTGNNLLTQLRRCALEYKCRAAQNYFLHRWELPMPTSFTCNADCVGCISLSHGAIPCTQERLKVPPQAEHVAQVALRHFSRVKYPVASFGQGCEGEPLTQAPLLLDIVKRVRAANTHGTLNLNTNGSLPDAVEALFRAGLTSMRVSMNSVRKDFYIKYHRPKSYQFEAVVDSIDRAKALGGFVSLNLLVFPGFTDREDEILALEDFLAVHRIDMIQWRNLNIDPQVYLETIGFAEGGEGSLGSGLLPLVKRLKNRFPALRHGYFNPHIDPSTRRSVEDAQP
jgi:pyruvate-formate lyase-activating enzyme